jgi:ribonucleoside-diphosphate reductase alpha chain
MDSTLYRDIFFSAATHKVLVGGAIMPADSNARALLGVVLQRLGATDRPFRDDKTDETFSELERLIEDGVCILGSPMLTNVAFNRETLSSCAAVPILRGVPGNVADPTAYYRLNMGSGFNLDGFVNPVEALYRLNDQAAELTRSRACERYIGNMAHISIHHPGIETFVTAKIARRDVVHFNISVDISDAFITALERDVAYALWDGRQIQARVVWDAIVDSAWSCGDPGIISLDRYNADNALARMSRYETTAPCAEVGLAAGETCVFGYINVAACLRQSERGLQLDENLVERAAACLTRVLDDAVEASLSGAPSPETATVMSQGRKIGIGICGFVDALFLMDIDYGDDAGNNLLSRTLSAIDFASKLASARLSASRGTFGKFSASRYATDPGFLSRRPTRPDRRRELEREVARWGLRNVMTTALPPSGRSSILLGVNGSIEPFLTFAVNDHSPLICRNLVHERVISVDDLGSVVKVSTQEVDVRSAACSRNQRGSVRSRRGA